MLRAEGTGNGMLVSRVRKMPQMTVMIVSLNCKSLHITPNTADLYQEVYPGKSLSI